MISLFAFTFRNGLEAILSKVGKGLVLAFLFLLWGSLGISQSRCEELTEPYLVAYSNLKPERKYLLMRDTILAGIKAVENIESSKCKRELYQRLAWTEGKLSHFYQKAIAYEKFAKAWEKSPDYDPIATGNAWRWAGKARVKFADYREAANDFFQAEKHYLASGSDQYEFLARTYTQIGQCFSRRGDLDKALLYHEKSQKNRTSGAVPAGFKVAVGYNNLALVFQKMGRFEDALDSGKKAWKNARNDKSIAIACNAMGLALLSMDSLDQAKTKLELSLEIFERIPKIDPLALAQARQALAQLYLKKGDFLQAENLLLQAVEIASSTSKISPRETAALRLALAKARESNGKHRLAVMDADQALPELFPDFIPKWKLANPDLRLAPPEPYIMDAFFTKGRNLLAMAKGSPYSQNLLFAAAEAFRLGFLQGNRIRRGIGPGVSKELIAGYMHQNFEPAIETQLYLDSLRPEKGHLELAFAYCELSKSMLLADQLAEGKLNGWVGIPEKWSEKKKNLQNRWRFFTSLHNHADNSIEKNVWNDSIFSVNRLLDQLNDQIQLEFPHYSRYLFPFNSHLKFRNKLPEYLQDHLLLSFFEGNEKYYAFAVFKGEISAKVILRDQQFRSRLNRFLDQISHNPIRDVNGREAFKNLSSDGLFVFEKLLRPLFQEGEIPDKMCIIPDGELWKLPFEALPVNQPKSAEKLYAGISWLVHQSTINYAYSAELLEDVQDFSSNENSGKVLAVAPGFLDEKSLQSRLKGLNLRSEPVHPLEASLEEIEGIRELLGEPVTLLRDSLAVESRFKELASEYSILHLSTHGLIDTLNYWNSGFLFAEANDPGENGILYLWEILNLRLQADLAVLSACQTGRGREVKGEGIMSLNRALTYAGVPSVVMSLWSVEDRSTQMQMVDFYKGLHEGLTYAGALRASKLHYLDREADALSAHPYYWAGFVQIGPPGQERKSSYGYWIAGILIVVLGTALMIKVQKKSSPCLRTLLPEKQ